MSPAVMDAHKARIAENEARKGGYGGKTGRG
jgi:hypothetical protein